MKKGIIIFLFLLLFLLFFTAVNADPAYCPYDIHLSIMYNYLTDQERELFDRMYDAIWQGETWVQVPDGMKYDDVYWMMDYFVNEAPELYAYNMDESKIFTRSETRMEIKLAYRASISSQKQFIQEVSRTAASFANKSDKEGIRAIFDYIIRKFSYDYDYSNDQPTAYAYYAIRNNKGVCNGYSQTMAMYCHFAGYFCSYIDGDVYGDNHQVAGRHAWNVALAGNDFIWMDATWDDGGTYAQNIWYGLSGKKMAESHGPDPEYKALMNLTTALPSGFTYSVHLDVNNANGYVRGVADKTGKTVMMNDLRSGEYYSPAIVIYSNGNPGQGRITWSINGYASSGSGTIGSGQNLIFRANANQFAYTLGQQRIVWFFNGNPVCIFTWTVEDDTDYDLRSGSSVLPTNMYYTYHLDMNNANGYVRGVTDQFGRDVLFSNLQPDEYYSPSLVIYNKSQSTQKMRVSYVLDGKSRSFSESTFRPGDGLLFRLSEADVLQGKKGYHEVTWYVNDKELAFFRWTVK